MLTDNLSVEFNKIKDNYGQSSLDRVNKMLATSQDWRHPLQKGAKYILPGLISEPWRKINEYAEIAQVSERLEKLHTRIQEEVNQLVSRNNDSLKPYTHYQVSMEDWKALYIFRNGNFVAQNNSIIPTTCQFYLDDLQELLCPLGEMHFSILKPGAKIPPHSDLWNFSLNLHFAVQIPKSCGIRVATETRNWEEGKCLLFDYSFEHEAWNNSDQVRICLLMDLWNPELTIAERKAVFALITEIRKLMSAEE